MLTNPVLQRIFIGGICGLLFGFGHRITRRLLEATAAVAALAFILVMVTGQDAMFQQVDLNAITAYVVRWGYEIVGLVGGFIVGYSIFERRSGEGK